MPDLLTSRLDLQFSLTPKHEGKLRSDSPGTIFCHQWMKWVKLLSAFWHEEKFLTIMWNSSFGECRSYQPTNLHYVLYKTLRLSGFPTVSCRNLQFLIKIYLSKQATTTTSHPNSENKLSKDPISWPLFYINF